MNYLLRLSLNLDSPDLCLLSSYNYRREPLVLSKTNILTVPCLTIILLTSGRGNLFVSETYSFSNWCQQEMGDGQILAPMGDKWTWKSSSFGLFFEKPTSHLGQELQLF
jgi:hypothetical protein